MNIDRAKEELSFHSGRNPSIDDARWQAGFLGSLRPYKDMSLVEANFHKVIDCLRVLSPVLRDSDTIEKGVVCDVSGILCLAKSWAVHKDGMLQRNGLITDSEAAMIDAWLDCISYAWAMMLDSQDETMAFEPYDEQFKI